MFRTYLKSFISMLIVFTLGFISISNVEAQSTNDPNDRVLSIKCFGKMWSFHYFKSKSFCLL